MDKTAIDELLKKDELTLSEIQEAGFEVLKWFKAFCEKENLRYFLTSGTLLGAVRHGGFIPWDDDVDVVMPRADYDRLIGLMKDLGGDERYRLYLCEGKRGQVTAVTKIYDAFTVAVDKRKTEAVEDLGVHIDVFALDGMGDSYSEAAELMKKLRPELNYRRWVLAGKFLFPKKRFWLFPVKVIGYLHAKRLGYEKIEKKIEALRKTYDFETSKFVGCCTSFGEDREIMPEELYRSASKVSFNGEQFDTCADPDAYLKRFYGENYMTPPPENKRVAAHYFSYYKREA